MTIEQIGNSIYTGLSTDNKAFIINPSINALFFERDTGVIYKFNFGWSVVNTSGSSGGGTGTGTISSASNVGASGIGFFKGINPADNLEFKKALAASNRISINTSGVDNVAFDVVEGNLNLANMGGVLSEVSLPIGSETVRGIVELSKSDGTENTGVRVIQDNDPRLTNTRTPVAHNHAGTDVNSGLIPAAQLPAATTAVKGAVILSTDNEATANEVVTATDSRLSNARTPLAHVHVGTDVNSGLVPAAQLPTATTTVKGAVILSTDNEATAGEVVTATDTRLSNARTPTAHVHDSVDITTGTINNARLTDASTSTKGIVQLGTSVQTTTGLAVQTSDTRLSDSRSPLAHVHAGTDVTTGIVPVASLPVATETTKGIVELGTSVETAAGLAVQTNDTRLSDSRSPTVHFHSGGDITSGTVSNARLTDASETVKGIVELATNVETLAGLAIQANDSRLTDSRTPTTHVHSGADITSGTVGVGVLPTASTSAKGISQLATSAQVTAGLVVQASDTRLSDPRTPTTHSHGNADITDLAYSKLTSVPTSFNPSAHNHSASEITSGILATAQGGTGKNTITQHSLLKGGATNSYSEIAPSTDGKVLKMVSGTPAWADESGGGGGTLTDVANVGTGDGTVYRDTTTGIINLKTVKAGTNVTVTNNTNDITISATGSGGGSMTASSLGTGEGTVFKDIVGSQINFRSLRQGTNVTISQDANEITINGNTVPDGSETVKGIVELSKSDGTENSGTRVIQDNDPRLTNSRTPTVHVHSGADITSGTVPIAQLPVASETAKGISELATSLETTAGLVVQANDTRLSDARTPTTHSHGDSTITDLAYSKLTGVPSTFNPTAHSSTHKSGGTDSIKIDELAAPTDVTTLNVSSTAHGLAPKHPNDITMVLRGDGTYGTMAPSSASYVVLGTNAVLSSERVLTQGTNITLVDAGAGSTLTLNVPNASTSTKGAVQLGISSDTTAGLAVQTNDTRLSDARTPTAHNHGDATITDLAYSKLTGVPSSFTPSTHKDTHKSGGSDPFTKGDDLNASSRYLEDIADPASDSQRIWIVDAGSDIKYWSDEAVPVKHIIEKQANKGVASGYASLDSGTLVPVAQLPAGTTTTKGVVELATSGENAANVVVQGNDSRLSDARTPTTHVHSGADITSGTVPIAQLPTATTLAKGIVQLGTSSDTTANLAVQTNDSRLTDSRTPTTHSHGDATITDLAYSKLTGVPSTFSPSAHATSHKSGGSDSIKLDELAAPTNITTLNVSTTAHGLTPILPNDATKAFLGDGTYGTVAPVGASYLTLGTNATLTTERVLTAGTNISFSDAGAGSTLTTNVPDGSTTVKGAVELATDGENTANVVVQGNDGRLSNARTPTAHKDSHKVGGGDAFVKGDDLNASSKYLEDITDPASDAQRIWIVDAGADIKYWSDEASPVKHTIERQANKGAASGYASLDSGTLVPVAQLPAATTTTKGVVELATDAENAANVVVQGNDTRLSDARTPLSHNHSTTEITSGTLGVVRGGTGVATVTSNSLLKGNGTSALSEITAGTNTHVLTMVAGAPAWAAPTGGGGSGEANTTSNAGTGEGTLALAKSGVDLPFKSLKQGTNIALTNNANDVTIDIGSNVTTSSNVQTLTNKTINGLDLNVNPKTASYTATSTDDIIPCAPAANMTITLPAASTSSGFLYRIQKTNSNAFTVTIDPNASELINGATTMVLTSQYQGTIIYCDGSAWYATAFGSERTGTATGTANGSSTVFNIAHGLGSTPYNAMIACSTHTNVFTYTTDATNIVVTFTTAPSSSPGTAIFHWRAVL